MTPHNPTKERSIFICLIHNELSHKLKNYISEKRRRKKQQIVVKKRHKVPQRSCQVKVDLPDNLMVNVLFLKVIKGLKIMNLKAESAYR